MRPVLTIVAVLVLLLIIGVATGFISLGARGGDMPQVKVEGGALPTVDADVGDIDVGTKNEVIEVPTISVDNARQDAAQDKDK
jgi:hypothetical protein